MPFRVEEQRTWLSRTDEIQEALLDKMRVKGHHSWLAGFGHAQVHDDDAGFGSYVAFLKVRQFGNSST